MKILEEDYGHWLVKERVNLRGYLGFTYVVIFENGKKYIGAKKIWRRIKQSPSEFKRGPRKGFEQSDWRTYMSSSNDIAGMILEGVKIKCMIITGWHRNWGSTLYSEAVQQMDQRVLSDESWLNHQIEGHFVKGCDDRLVLSAKNFLAELISGTPMALTKTVITSKTNGFFLTDEKQNFKMDLEDALRFNVSLDDLKKLLNGSIDSIDDRIYLPKKYRIISNQLFQTSTDTWFRIFKDAQDKTGLTRKQILEDPDFIQYKPETRAAFKQRLEADLNVSLKAIKQKEMAFN